MAPHLPLSGESRDELTAIVALLQGEVVPKAQIVAFIEYFGSAVEALRFRLAGQEGVLGQQSLFEAIPEALWTKAQAEVDSWDALPYQYASSLSERYPVLLRSIFNPPPLLFWEGEDPDVEAKAVAIVGTRQATDYGRRRATKLAKVLGENGYTIVSGLARGIDTAAHEAALQVGARTIAVVGTGLTRTYPEENAELARRIVAAGGSLVSQFFPHTPPTRWGFPLRNVTMSGLSVATIVVEASETSGARQQARNALQHGRSVFLLRSLVESHAWARKMVDVGYAGSKAEVLDDPSTLLQRATEPLRAFAIG